jgi:hypothetical protein
MGKKCGAIVNNLGEHNKEPLRTFSQHEENYRETHWEHQNPKNWGLSWVHAASHYLLHSSKLCSPTSVSHPFWAQLISQSKIVIL